MKLEDYNIELPNGWSALFRYKGEFRMGCDGWDLILSHTSGESIDYFTNSPVLVNDYDGSSANNAIKVSNEPNFIVINTDLDSRWVLNLSDRTIAPVLFRIHHNVKGKYLSALEQPCYKAAQEYIQLKGELVYLTFPLTPVATFKDVFEDYLEIRKRQLEETYFA